jgi:hypothetical protein
MRRFYPSASTFELWLMCPARALGKVLHGIKEPFGPAAAEGTRLHKVTQKAMVTGQLPPPSEVAVHKIVAALPVPLGTIDEGNTERVLVIPHVHGFMDWADDFNRHGDLKFTSNVRYQQQKDPTKDPQRIFYAQDHFYRDPYAESFVQTWSVSQFNGARALRLDHTWTRRAVRQSFEKNLAKELDALNEAVHSRQDWQTAKKNPGEACSKYPPHGCPMLKHGCKRSGSANLVQLQTPTKIKVTQ